MEWAGDANRIVFDDDQQTLTVKAPPAADILIYNTAGVSSPDGIQYFEMTLYDDLETDLPIKFCVVQLDYDGELISPKAINIGPVKWRRKRLLCYKGVHRIDKDRGKISFGFGMHANEGTIFVTADGAWISM
ncbi:hypothetical protein PsYK624_123050 [Phanerochaete sordida]|uniref:Uncharacterized protein n=1 Tax=Phanerochaete sordida TaxID=48140 RepID=A0A9P3GIB5_9APHY|nr:hypothetical protein PsYK624_123050 [Phanerochaete sordida]